MDKQERGWRDLLNREEAIAKIEKAMQDGFREGIGLIHKKNSSQFKKSRYFKLAEK